MTTLQALFALAAIILMTLAAFKIGSKVSLALLAAACALVAYFIPLLHAAFN